MKKNINTIICDRCGEIIEEYEYHYATMPPYRLCTCKCGNIMSVVDELYEKYKKEVNEIIITDKELIIRDH